MGIKRPISIRPARTSKDFEAAAHLFTSYSQWLGIDLTFQDFEEELESLPGKYKPPRGEIFLACTTEEDVVGCVAVRPSQPDGFCEMKRLYVTPGGRGYGTGKKLVEAILEKASSLGYREIRLDTLPTMHEAIKLYKTVGFTEISAYYNTPIPDTVFFARKLPI